MQADGAPLPDTFCAACNSASTDQSPGDVNTNNGIGLKFYGGADRCPTCHSIARTLWFVVADVPLLPRGTYRYKNVSDETHEGFFVQSSSRRFIARRTATNWSQVGSTWAIGIIAAIALVFVFTRIP